MRIAAYTMAGVFLLTAIAIVAAMAVGFSNGLIQLDGGEMTFAWQGSGDVAPLGGDPILHQSYFYITTSVYAVAVIGILPLVLLGILTAVLFGRSSSKDSS
ncbi:hypothetical protein LOC68_04905 [Blastopirellula sp. JC732]|uniref:Uncharacterized protein n=1 Tax=Blastopirellula sediminis TaxID=2894196 RepID=A0A9X1MLJ0_9BACT|nr:hypothetical protein [Blastopirellula sediminis]MCC9609500.1 hypothetical protein [Blastopirellula sediminis]MCC9627724.1 hypothetical protein [Blastopirellula sediminis]